MLQSDPFHQEGIMFEDQMFFLKVTRKARRGRWFFFVQVKNKCFRFGPETIFFI